jgi:hypothetical protein
MISLKKLLAEASILVYRVKGNEVEKFVKKYPKVKQIMDTLVKKNKDLMRGYKAFLKFKDKQEDYLGGKAEQTKSNTFGTKTFYKYDFGGVKGGWPEVYQYLYTMWYGGIDGATVESVNESSFQKGKTYGGTKCEGGCYVGKQGLMKLIKISKDNPNNVFMFRDDNYSGIQPHFIKNGVIAIAKTINPSYDLEKNKVRNLKIGNDVILSVKLFEGVNESIITEGNWAKIMTGVRKGSLSGPWTIVIIQNKKVIHQEPVKIKDAIPASYEAMKRKFRNAVLSIEDNHGKIVYSEKI